MSGSEDQSTSMTSHRRALVLDRLFGGTIDSQDAARQLASISLMQDAEDGLNMTWAEIMGSARQSSSHHDKLVEVLIALSSLPRPTDSQGQPLVVYDMAVWDDLPMLGWLFNYEWNGLSIPAHQPERDTEMTAFINVNMFTAKLMRTGAAAFAGLDLFALWTMRSAAETPASDMEPEAYIPAAAAWFAILGKEIYSWDKEFVYGGVHGDPGRGGLLYPGETHGFSRERWAMWRRRFGELSTTKELGFELQSVAKAAEIAMLTAERQ